MLLEAVAAPSVLTILRPEHRIMFAGSAIHRMVGRARSKDIVYSFLWPRLWRRHVGPCCQDVRLTVRASNDFRKTVAASRFHAIVYLCSQPQSKNNTDEENERWFTRLT
jgi:hypothetical protein